MIFYLQYFLNCNPTLEEKGFKTIKTADDIDVFTVHEESIKNFVSYYKFHFEKCVYMH